MFDEREQSLRDRYQAVVIATAEIRAWGVEWLLCFACEFNDVDRKTDTRETRASLMNHLKNAKKMLHRDIDDIFRDRLDVFPATLNAARSKAHDSLEASLEKFEEMEARAKNSVPPPAVLLDMCDRHVENCGASLNIFLAELNDFLASEEDANNGSRVSLIRAAIDEIDNINMMINLIAVNASVEAAHAGEAGKGFSVIASEIQSLSLKSRSVFGDLQKRISAEDQKEKRNVKA